MDTESELVYETNIPDWHLFPQPIECSYNHSTVRLLICLFLNHLVSQLVQNQINCTILFQRSKFHIDVNDHSFNTNLHAMCCHKVRPKYYINRHIRYNCIYSTISISYLKHSLGLFKVFILFPKADKMLLSYLSSGFVSLILSFTLVVTNSRITLLKKKVLN